MTFSRSRSDFCRSASMAADCSVMTMSRWKRRLRVRSRMRCATRLPIEAATRMKASRTRLWAGVQGSGDPEQDADRKVRAAAKTKRARSTNPQTKSRVMAATPYPGRMPAAVTITSTTMPFPTVRKAAAMACWRSSVVAHRPRSATTRLTAAIPRVNGRINSARRSVTSGSSPASQPQDARRDRVEPEPLEVPRPRLRAGTAPPARRQGTGATPGAWRRARTSAASAQPTPSAAHYNRHVPCVGTLLRACAPTPCNRRIA